MKEGLLFVPDVVCVGETSDMVNLIFLNCKTTEHIWRMFLILVASLE